MTAPAVPRETSPLVIAADRLRAGQRARAGLRPPTFASPEQRTFYESEAPELLYSGWMGAGKSRILCEKAWALALHHPGAELGIFRKVKASMPATTERTFWEEVADQRYVMARNRSENWVDLAQPGQRPSRIWFLGLDPDPKTGTPTKVGSLNLDWVGVDEAIELTDADWMMLQGRLRRTAIGYRQIAAATNPASPRHWLKARFTPSTDERVFLVASGNTFLPPDYAARLEGLGTGYHAQRLGKGLWVAAEGTIWLLPDDQIVRPEQTTFRRKVAGIDWGFVHAFACEVVGETGTGRRAVIDEVYERGQLVEDLIPRLLELQAEGVEVFYADPSEPEYIATCRRKGLNVLEATNDVVPGITAVGTAFQHGMTVSPDCTGLLGEIPEYVWQRDRASGLEKEKPVEVGDDACLAAGTRIETQRGPVPIEDVRVGDSALTRAGFRAIVASGLTNEAAAVVELRTTDGRTLVATPNHPVHVEGVGFVRMDALRYAMMLSECRPSTLSSSAGSPSAGIRTRPTWRTGPTSRRASLIASAASRTSIARSGRRPTARSRRATTSTTLTPISSTTTSATSSRSRLTSTRPSTRRCLATSRRPGPITSTRSVRRLPSGTAPMRGASGIASTRSTAGLIGSPRNVSAPGAATRSSLATLDRPLASVRTPARLPLGERRASTTSIESAPPVGRPSRSTATSRRPSAPVAVLGVFAKAERAPVYNLTVDGDHEYYANGLLTHNCDALRYAVMGLDQGAPGVLDHYRRQAEAKAAAASPGGTR